MSTNGFSVSVRKPTAYDGFSERVSRGPVHKFSKSAQSNLKRLWRDISWPDYLSDNNSAKNAQGFFLTLVCDQDQQPSQAKFKRLKDALRVGLVSNFPTFIGGIWKAERQQDTDTPHLHVVAFFDQNQNTAELHNWLNEKWCSLTGNHEIAFKKHSVDVQTLYGDPLRLRNYLLKAPCTNNQEWALGKVWGEWCKETLPIKKATIINVTDDVSDMALEWAVCTHPATRERALKLYSCEARDRRGFSHDGLSPQTMYDLRTLLDEYTAMGLIDRQDDLIKIYAAKHNITLPTDAGTL